MTKNIGRNDPCPCGSGVKYKRCCLAKEKQTKAINQDVVKNKFDEDYVIGALLKSSKEFNAFYKAERAKITQPIEWIKDESLQEESPARYGHIDENNGVIRLRRIPPEIEDAVIIAHELQHAVIISKGFPGTICNESQYEYLSTALNTMVHDPLVHKTLQIYGFDLLDDFTKWANKSLNKLKTLHTPTSHPAKMQWVFNYVKKIIHWEIVRTEGDGNSEFQLRFESHYPELANVGQELLVLVKSIGYDTPDKMHKLLREIVLRYELSDYISEDD